MYNLDPAQLKQIFQTTKRSKLFFTSSFKSFVETGTHAGHTIIALHKYFDKLYTVEIAEHLYNTCKEEFNKRGINNVEIVLGDSVATLPLFIKKIETDTIFWLDGHCSGGSTGKGDKDVPLMEEIKAINDFPCRAAIIIDDARLFGSNTNEDWSEITEKNIINKKKS
jgi:hypothetical protein